MEQESTSPVVDLLERRGVAPIDLLEQGKVLLVRESPFRLQASEEGLLTPAISDGNSKNISFDAASKAVGGTNARGTEREQLAAMMERFAISARELILRLFPDYGAHLDTRLTSFRPVSVEGRQISPRKDDSRLHVDAFASRPNQGRRLLRVFTNVNARGRARVWMVGEPFEDYARRFLPRVARYSPGAARWLERLRITKLLRSEYDHVMLQLHDIGKLDVAYQRSAPATRIEFQPSVTWICYTDQVLHAALSGQHMLEQTYLLPVQAMADPNRSPLRVLERMLGRSLV